MVADTPSSRESRKSFVINEDGVLGRDRCIMTKRNPEERRVAYRSKQIRSRSRCLVASKQAILVRLLGCALAFFLVADTVGEASQGEGTTRPINARCPVMPDENVDPSITTIYQGRTVAFCCDRCLAKFKANPEQYASRLATLGNAEHAPQPGQSASATTRGEEHGRAGGKADQHEHSDAHAEPAKGEHGGGDDVKGQASQSPTVDGHDHEHGKAKAGEERPPLLGRLHPIIIHFPVAGVPLALLCLALWILTGQRVFSGADVPPLIAAALASIAAVVTGNIAHDSMRFSASLHDIVHRHQLAGTSLMVLLLCVSAFRLWRWGRLTGRWLWVYVGCLAAASLLVGLTGHLGGSLVFGPDHLRW